MPLLEKTDIFGGGSMAIWQIDESDAYFEKRLDPSEEEWRQINRLKGRRKTEWLASRWLLHLLSGRMLRGQLQKDEYGKPSLIGSKNYISISHTHNFTAVIAAPFLVGIDIQVRVSKIGRIAHKFLNAKELENVSGQRPLDYMHVYWGAKECMYKAYGRRALDFRRDLSVRAFNIEEQKTIGVLRKGAIQYFDLFFTLSDAYILVFALENHGV